MTDIIEDGLTKVYFVPTISSTSAPTVAELNAGEGLETFLVGGIGLDPGTDAVDTTSIASTTDTELPGRQTMAGDSVFKDQGRGVAPWTTFAAKQAGYLAVRRHVDCTQAWAASDKVEVYTIKAGQRKPQAVAANDISKFGTRLFHTAKPVMDATVAA